MHRKPSLVAIFSLLTFIPHASSVASQQGTPTERVTGSEGLTWMSAFPRWLSPVIVDAEYDPATSQVVSLFPMFGARMDVDSRHVVHIAAVRAMPAPASPILAYYNNRYDLRRCNGFSAPFELTNNGGGFDIAVGAGDQVHVVWQRSTSQNFGTQNEPQWRTKVEIFLRTKTSAGWSPEFMLLNAAMTQGVQEQWGAPKIMANASGLHLIATWNRTTFDQDGIVQDLDEEMRYVLTGMGQTIETIPGTDGVGLWIGDFDLDSNGQPWVVWTDGVLNLNSRAGGGWGGSQTFAGAGALGPQIAMDSLNNPHLVWSAGGQVFHRYTAGGVVSQVSVDGVDGGTSARVVVDSRDQVHVVWTGGPPGPPPSTMCYAARVKNPSPTMLDSTWRIQDPIFTTTAVPSIAIPPSDMVISANDQIHIIDEITYTRTMEYNLGERTSDSMYTAFTCGQAKVNLTNGNLHINLPLFTTEGVGPCQGIEFIYNSLEPYSGYLSQGWKLNYEMYLIDHWGFTSDPEYDRITLVLGDGRSIVFSTVTFGYYTAEPEFGYVGMIQRSSATTLYPMYYLRLPSGDVMTFDTDGRLVEIRDSVGNYIQLVYEEGRLTAVSDMLGNGGPGRTSTIAYQPGSNQLYGRRILSISDAAGSQYSMGYTQNKLDQVVFAGVDPAPTFGWTYSDMNNSLESERINHLRVWR